MNSAEETGNEQQKSWKGRTEKGGAEARAVFVVKTARPVRAPSPGDTKPGGQTGILR
jgi:hypothetical protein